MKLSAIWFILSYLISSLQFTDVFVFEQNDCQDGAQCFHLFCYKYFQRKVDVLHIMETGCVRDPKHRNSSIISIHSKEENDFVAAMLKHYKSQDDIWTSGYCRIFQPPNINSNCQWMVSNDVQLMPMNYTADIKYDNSAINNSVVFLITKQSGYKKWLALHPDTNHKHPFICKWRNTEPHHECPNRPDSGLDTTTDIPNHLTTPSSTSGTDVTISPFCNSTQSGGITWPPTPAGHTSLQPCPLGSSGQAFWLCDESTLTFSPPGEPLLTGCKHNWLIQIEDKVNGGNYSAGKIVLALWIEISSTSQLYVLDLIATQEILSQILDSAHKTASDIAPPVLYEITVMTVKICSQILHDKHMKTWQEMQSVNMSTTAYQISENVESAGFLLTDGFANISHRISEPFIDLNVEHNAAQHYANFTLTFTLQDYGITVIFPKSVQNIKSQDQDVRIVVAAFRNLEKLLLGNTRDSNRYHINSQIVEVSFGHMTQEIHFPDDKLQLHFSTTDRSITGQPICSFWNITSEHPSGNWHKEGCWLLEFDDNVTKCICDHLTSFAVIMDINGIINHLSPQSQRALEILTVIGVTVSVVCLMLSIAGFHLCRALHGIRTSITKNLCICLLVGDVFMLFGLDRTNNQVVCAVIASILVFSFTASFLWMLMEGIHLYVLLSRVFQLRTSPLRWYYLASYSFPAVALSLGLGINRSAYGTDNYCWLDTRSAMFWSFAGPVAIIIAMNIIFLALALKTSWEASRTRKMSLSKNIRQWTRGSLSLTSVLGITWIFGFFYLDTTTQLFAYLFTILNSMQGCLIFGFHCVLNEHTRHALLRSLSRCNWRIKCKRGSKRKMEAQAAVRAVCSRLEIDRNLPKWPAAVSTPSTSSTSETPELQNPRYHPNNDS